MSALGAAVTPDVMASMSPAYERVILTRDPLLDVLACDLNADLGALGTMLVTIQRDALFIVGAMEPAELGGALFEALEDLQEIWDSAASRGNFCWFQTTKDGRIVSMFVASLRRSADNAETLAVSMFDSSKDPASRGIEVKFAQRRALAASYLDLWQSSQFRRQRELALEAALSTIRTGIILLDDKANVVFANAVAHSMLDSADCLKLQRGRLVTTNLRDNVRLSVALQHISAPPEDAIDRSAPMLALERGDRTLLIVLALPLGASDSGYDDAVTILHVVDPKVDFAEHVRPLCRFYQLSRTETDLACLLANGMTLALAAETMRLKEQTARSSLRSIFYKTGTGRQTELVLLLLSRVVPTSSSLKIEPF